MKNTNHSFRPRTLIAMDVRFAAALALLGLVTTTGQPDANPRAPNRFDKESS